MAVTSNLGRVVGATIIVKASQPTVRDDNSKLLEGDIWINSTTQQLYKYQGGTFIDTGINIKGEKGDAGSSLTLGETSSTAYAGNKGKQNADNISDIYNQLGRLGPLAEGVRDDLNEFKRDYENNVGQKIEDKVETLIATDVEVKAALGIS